MIVAAIILIVVPSDEKYRLVIDALAFGLAVKGAKDIVFYFSMARHMVGGKMILIQGVIILDFALLTITLAYVPDTYMLLYLIGVKAFAGVVETLRALESRRTVEGPWKLKMLHGTVDFALAVLCLFYVNEIDMAIIIYGAGLIYSGVLRIIDAFRRTAFIVIE